MGTPGTRVLDALGNRKLCADGRVALFDASGVSTCCASYRRARKCTDNSLADIWMTNADAATRPFFSYGDACYKFNFADAIVSSAGSPLVVASDTALLTDCVCCDICIKTAAGHLVLSNTAFTSGCLSAIDPGTGQTMYFSISGTLDGVYDLTKSITGPGTCRWGLIGVTGLTLTRYQNGVPLCLGTVIGTDSTANILVNWSLSGSDFVVDFTIQLSVPGVGFNFGTASVEFAYSALYSTIQDCGASGTATGDSGASIDFAFS